MSIALILNFLVAIPKIGDLVMGVVTQIIAWYVQGANNATLSELADAASASAAAKDTASRLVATDLWVKAMSRPRVSTS